MLEPALFVKGGDDEQLKQVVSHMEEYLLFDARSVVLIGPSTCGKSSLLFQYAYHAATLSHRVWWICRRKKMETNFVVFPTSEPPLPRYLEQIQIKYIEEHRTLRQFLANLPLLPEDQFPDLLIIDDLSEYFPVGMKSVSHHRDYLLEVLALLKEAQMYAERRWAQPHRLTWMCALGMSAKTESFQAIERWAEAILIVKGTQNPFELSFYSIHKQPDPSQLQIVYSVTTSHLEIRGIRFNEQEDEEEHYEEDPLSS